MTHCNRLEREGWLSSDAGDGAGDEIRAHLRECPDCQELWRKHQRIESALSRVGADYAPSASARARLAAALDAERFRRPRMRRWALLGVPAVAAAAILLLLLRPPPVGPEHAALHVEVVPGDGAARRTSMPRIGDHLRARADIGRASHVALRVYRNRDRLLLACPGDARCQAGARILSADLRLDAAGVYEVLLLTSETALPAPPEPDRRSIDEVIQDATAAGADYQLHDLQVE